MSNVPSPFHHSHYDAVIVGARCAGAATALLLARSGLRVLLVDRQSYGSDTLSTHALMRVGVLQLHRFGLLERLARTGAPAVRRTVFHYGTDARFEPGSDPGAIDLAIKPRFGVDALYAPRRTVLDRMLVDAAREAGVEVHHHVSLRALARDARGVVTAAVLSPEGWPLQRVAARWVIGADGRRSSVAAMIGAPFTRVGAAAAATIYGYYAGLGVDEREPAYRWLYGPGVGAGIIPTHDGQACVFAGAPAARVSALLRAVGTGEPALRALVAETSPVLERALAGARRLDKPRVFLGAPGFMRKPWGPGWALVGDAGAFRDPLTAHGISDALRDAELLARALLADDLPGYEAARDALCTPLFDVTEQIAACEWTLDELPHLHRALNRTMTAQCEVIAAVAPLPQGRVRVLGAPGALTSPGTARPLDRAAS